jgi:hypothetical protein
VEIALTAEDRNGPTPGGPARFLAGLAFFYSLVVTVVLLALEGMFRDDPDRETVLLWLVLPVVSSFGSWLAVRSGFSPLRVWVWLAVLMSLFFVWIAVFSVGLWYLPVPLLLLVAVLIPWRESGREPDA